MEEKNLPERVREFIGQPQTVETAARKFLLQFLAEFSGERGNQCSVDLHMAATELGFALDLERKAKRGGL